MTYGRQLKQILTEKGWKSADLARAAGIPTSTLAMYTGDYSTPPLSYAIQICKVLGVPVETFAECEFCSRNRSK